VFEAIRKTDKTSLTSLEVIDELAGARNVLCPLRSE